MCEFTKQTSPEIAKLFHEPSSFPQAEAERHVKEGVNRNVM
jgi:hypothetical protein